MLAPSTAGSMAAPWAALDSSLAVPSAARKALLWAVQKAEYLVEMSGSSWVPLLAGQTAVLWVDS
jgi:hypothetical protein